MMREKGVSKGKWEEVEREMKNKIEVKGECFKKEENKKYMLLCCFDNCWEIK